MTGADRMHAAMAGWPGRALKPASRVQGPTCENCRYWTGRATWRTVAHFLSLGFWQAPEWGLCRSRTSHLSRTKTWAMVGCRSWQVVLRKGSPEPSDDETVRNMALSRREEESAPITEARTFRSIMLGAVLACLVFGGTYVVACLVTGTPL